MAEFKKEQVDKPLENLEEPMREEPQIRPTDQPSPRNPSAHGTARGPEDEENQYGNDVTGPNLGADLSNDELPPNPVDDELNERANDIPRDDFDKNQPKY